MKNPESKSQALDNAIQVLDHFTLENPEWGVRELGRALGMSPTKIYRVVSTLRTAAYLDQNPETQRYTLGPKVVKLAGIYTRLNPLPKIAQSIFEKYTDRFEFNFYLGRLNNYEMIYLAVLDGRGPLKIVVDPGGSTTLHSTALGKVLLAYQNESFLAGFLEMASLSGFTGRTITDPKSLMTELNQIRTRGYAVNDGEHYDSIGAVGVPVLEKSGHVHLGVSLAYPRNLLLQDNLEIDNLVDLAKCIAEEISPHIDYP